MDNLYQAENGKHYYIEALGDNKLLHSLGIYQGALVKKVITYALGGPVLLMVDQREVAVGKAYALAISVREKEVTLQ